MNSPDWTSTFVLAVRRMRALQKEVTPGEHFGHREARKAAEEKIDRMVEEWVYMYLTKPDDQAEGGEPCPQP